MVSGDKMDARWIPSTLVETLSHHFNASKYLPNDEKEKDSLELFNELKIIKDDGRKGVLEYPAGDVSFSHWK